MSEVVVESLSKVARLLEEGGTEVEPVSLPYTEELPNFPISNFICDRSRNDHLHTN